LGHRREGVKSVIQPIGNPTVGIPKKEGRPMTQPRPLVGPTQVDELNDTDAHAGPTLLAGAVAFGLFPLSFFPFLFYFLSSFFFLFFLFSRKKQQELKTKNPTTIAL